MTAMLTNNSSRVFITGATGYLGAHLVSCLLTQSNVSLKCLVRAEDAESGFQRLRSALESYNLWQSSFQSRLEIINGDLAKPCFGKNAADFSTLCQDVDLIIHNGAWVNYVLPYSQLKSVNVDATQEILRLAKVDNIPLLYISTLRLFDSRMDGIAITENDTVNEKGTTYAGYSRSKWIAEKLINNAMAQGLPAQIVRPGLICGGKHYPAPNLNDAIARLLKGCVQLAYAPDSKLQVNLTPLDYVLYGIVDLLQHSEASGLTYHLVTDQPTPCNTLLQTLIDTGFSVNFLDYKKWTQHLLDQAKSSDNSLLPLLQYFDADLPEQSTKRIFNSEKTQSYLKKSTLDMQTVDIEVMTNNIEGMLKSGYLQLVQHARAI